MLKINMHCWGKQTTEIAMMAQKEQNKKFGLSGY